MSQVLAFQHEEAIFVASEALRSLTQNCIDDNMINQGVSEIQVQTIVRKSGPTPIERICTTAESLLGFQFSTFWDLALQVVSVLFDKLGVITCIDNMAPDLELRDKVLDELEIYKSAKGRLFSSQLAIDRRGKQQLEVKLQLDTKAGVSESAEYMECAGAITRGNSDAHGCEWMSIGHISKVTDGHISKESELGLDASTGPLHGHEVTTRSPSAELKVPVNIDSGSPKQKDEDLPIPCQTEEKDKRTEPCQKKGTRLTHSCSINTSRSSINTNLSDDQPSIIPVKVVDESMDWKGLIKPTSECGVAGDCDTFEPLPLPVSISVEVGELHYATLASNSNFSRTLSFAALRAMFFL
ncbi:hypothetical protein SUGI_0130240 [Cryptomeria japonica]|nr:hypothetical protein SUGI_0130240 [Cryptomeria japonica]